MDINEQIMLEEDTIRKFLKWLELSGFVIASRPFEGDRLWETGLTINDWLDRYCRS
jgi:hypothetical protein